MQDRSFTPDTARLALANIPHNEAQALPAPVLRSWLRCADLGLDRDAKVPYVDPLPAHALRPVFERNEALRRRCRGELEALFAATRAKNAIAVLSDADGLVLDAIGSADFADKAAEVTLRPGASWSEAATGTNAVGTALFERRAVEILGGQHFLNRNKVLSCAAAPILGPRGEILGALDLSGHSKTDHGFALGLVQMAVDAIEHRAFETEFPGCEIIRLHSDSALIGTPREGILVFRDSMLIAANRYGLDLLDLEWDALDRRTYRTLFPSQERAGADGIILRDTSGRPIPAQTRRPQTIARPTLAKPSVEHSGPQPKQAATPTHFLDEAGKARMTRAVRLLDAGVPVLVQGETGSGKEVFARAVHAASLRRTKPFVAINCTALPESLIEAELFGYEPGAFTGARRGGARGLLREADGGLLFLDEIGDMPLSLQPRLLRALQEREVLPVGAVKAVPIDVTLVCATHRDLTQLVAEGQFRADLYYRIAPYTIDLPSVRAVADRRALVRDVWASLDPHRRNVRLSSSCEAALTAYDWPGNYRQLVGTLQAMLALAEDGECLSPDALPRNVVGVDTPRAATSTKSSSAKTDASEESLSAIEKAAIRDAMRACNGNVSQAARRLGINRSTLYRRYLSDKDEMPRY